MSRTTDKMSNKDTSSECNRKINYIIREHINDIVFILDEDGKIADINNAVERYGYTPADVIGKDIMEFVHPEDRSMNERCLKERRTGDRCTKDFHIRMFTEKTDIRILETHIVRNLNFSFSVDAEGFYSGNGKKTRSFMGTFGIARDITEQKRVENEIHESRLRYKSLFENTGNATCTFSDDAVITVDQHGIGPAEFLDRCGNLSDLGVSMRPGVPDVGDKVIQRRVGDGEVVHGHVASVRVYRCCHTQKQGVTGSLVPLLYYLPEATVICRKFFYFFGNTAEGCDGSDFAGVIVLYLR